VKGEPLATDGRWVGIEDMPREPMGCEDGLAGRAAVTACMPSVPVGWCGSWMDVIRLKVVLLTVTACYTVADGVLDPLLRLQLAD
jgi:hypothetical protein